MPCRAMPYIDHIQCRFGSLLGFRRHKAVSPLEAYSNEVSIEVQNIDVAQRASNVENVSI